MNHRWIGIAALAGALVAGTLGAQERGGRSADRVAFGQRMFMEHGCYGCHTVGKVGTPIGPDLSHIGGRRSEGELKVWLRDPAFVRPAAHMPALELSAEQIGALAAFLASLD
jgi:cytochrome c oxidase subunit 2